LPRRYHEIVARLKDVIVASVVVKDGLIVASNARQPHVIEARPRVLDPEKFLWNFQDFSPGNLLDFTGWPNQVLPAKKAR
jgi:hypothetical protein